MLLREVSLKNIRSFNDDSEASIAIPEGTLLFEGDVGSGKSTVLYAIEFALFGLGDVSGSFLLSEGKNAGHVRVRVAQGTRALEVFRGLRRRAGNVIQENCYISEDGIRTELSPGDLKQRVISLLGFNEPSHPRAESLVYRYAVFTPQEQMKEIVQRNAGERLLVVRRVLGIQSYQTAAENSDLVHRRLRNQIKGIEMATEDLEKKESEARAEQARIDEIKSRIPELQREEASAKGELDSLTERFEMARDEREKVASIAGRIPELRRSMARLRSDISSEQGGVAGLEESLKQESASVEAFRAKVPPSRRSAKALETSLRARQKSLEKKLRTLALLEAQLKETKDLVKAKVCPRCCQPIPKGFKDQSSHLARELGRSRTEVSKLEAEVSNLERLARATLLYQEEKKRNVRDLQQKIQLEKQIAEGRNHIADSLQELARLTEQASKSEAQEARLKELISKIDAMAAALKEARKRKDSASRELTEATTLMSEAGRTLERAKSEIEEKKKRRGEAERLKSYTSWLAEFFKPTVELIEKQTMVQSNARFSQHFQRFFSSLVDDPDLRVRVVEDFSPVFERQGYSQEYDSLSGGERTSVALAYRFALNVVVQEDVGSGTGDLLILDEPTDGFSKEQIQKMRYILEELHSKQVILVSHEKELESMADRILLVEKTNGTSRISPL